MPVCEETFRVATNRSYSVRYARDLSESQPGRKRSGEFPKVKAARHCEYGTKVLSETDGPGGGDDFAGSHRRVDAVTTGRSISAGLFGLPSRAEGPQTCGPGRR
jgi:hypothetical protein